MTCQPWLARAITSRLHTTALPMNGELICRLTYLAVARRLDTRPVSLAASWLKAPRWTVMSKTHFTHGSLDEDPLRW